MKTDPSSSSFYPYVNMPESSSGNNYSTTQSAPNAKLIDAEHREKIARNVYVDNVVYHATESSSKDSIRKHGFQTKRKRDGAMKRLTQDVMMEEYFIKNAKKHNYVMTDKEAAKDFKYFTSPSLVRAFKGDVRFEMDPDFNNGSAMRTRQDIPADNIVGSKKSAPSRGESKTMQAAMARAGVKVNSKEAGRLLRTVQSDSEDDF